MLIECGRCHAVFSLQESVTAPGSTFKVQCGRCLAVFDVTAAPAATVSPAPPEASRARPPPPPAQETAPAAEPPRPRSALAVSIERWAARPAARIVLAALALAISLGIVLYRRGLPRDAEQNLRIGREKLLLDDAKSLQDATRLFTDAVRAAPGQAVPEAERALALLLQAGAHKDLSGRVPASEREPEARAASRFLQQGAAAARQAIAEEQDAPAALRAMALADALSGAANAGMRAEQAERVAPGDPWALYVKAAAAAAAGSRDRAVQALSAARQAQPKLLRADVDLAAIAIDGGDPAGARQLLQRVLRENPQHERARRMLSLLPP